MPGSTFCNYNTETIGETNYNNNFKDKTYSGVKEKSCLPGDGEGFTQVDATTGVVPQASLDAHVTTLMATWSAVPLTLDELASTDNIESSTNDPAALYGNKAQALRNSIHREYCFYYKRYLWILQDVLTKAAAGSKDTVYTDRKDLAKKINSKLNQILQILQTLVNLRTATLNSYYGSGTGVNKLNDELTALRTQLTQHSTKLQNKTMEQDVQSAMIEYSIEKNSSSRNLLGIYGFMNIVAIGLLFYLYRSSKN